MIEIRTPFFPPTRGRATAIQAGFRFGHVGTHTSRTMMLEELTATGIDAGLGAGFGVLCGTGRLGGAPAPQSGQMPRAFSTSPHLSHSAMGMSALSRSSGRGLGLEPAAGDGVGLRGALIHQHQGQEHQRQADKFFHD